MFLCCLIALKVHKRLSLVLNVLLIISFMNCLFQCVSDGFGDLGEIWVDFTYGLKGILKFWIFKSSGLGLTLKFRFGFGQGSGRFSGAGQQAKA